MSETVKPLNAAALNQPTYAEPVLGNPVSTLMESGVGNCFPGLEFDLRQLDVRFFPGLVFDFPGVTPAGPDGTQGAVLVYADTGGDPVFDLDYPWVTALKSALNGTEGGALGDGTWYLHWVEQGGQRIELYDFALYQNALTRTPYEGETCWWIIRLIEVDPDPALADLTIALTQRDASGAPTGNPVVLRGKRRSFLDEDGMISDVYHPGELTSSMCSPWTHDFRDCACQYWASNHPDVALGPVQGPTLPDGTSEKDPRQSVSFLDWMRRRDLPRKDVTAQTTISKARPDRYDPYEINLKWEELSFVLQGEETRSTPHPKKPVAPEPPYADFDEVVEDLRHNLAPLEFSLSMEYLYAYFSLRCPDEVTAQEAQTWPQLADDLRAVRQFLLLVALSEMTHMRWTNQMMWLLAQDGKAGGTYEPVVHPSQKIPMGEHGPKDDRDRKLRPVSLDLMKECREIERPQGDLDTEYCKLVAFLRSHADQCPKGLFELAVRIDSDGLHHFQKFSDIVVILSRYEAVPEVFTRPVALAEQSDPRVQDALTLLDDAVRHLKTGYTAEFEGNMPVARDSILAARDKMHDLEAEAERLARYEHIGVPFFPPVS